MRHANDNVGILLLQSFRTFLPGIESNHLLRLDLHVDKDLELPVILFLATPLNSVWKLRLYGKRVITIQSRPDLESYCRGHKVSLDAGRMPSDPIKINNGGADFCKIIGKHPKESKFTGVKLGWEFLPLVEKTESSDEHEPYSM